MTEVSIVRLYVLRAMYLVMAAGLGLTIWPLLLRAGSDVEHMRSVVWALLGALAVLALLGVRYPLQLLPLLLFELLWKVIWLLVFALPLWRAGTLEGPMRTTAVECLMGLVLLVVIPWGYVYRNYVGRPGDRWRRAA